MNILFIFSLQDIQSPNKPLGTPEQIQFGISYISSLLKKNNHNTKLIVLSRILGKRNIKVVDDYVRKFAPKLICFTAVYSEYDFITGMAEYIKRQYPGIYLLIGGCHVSLSPDEILSNSFDSLCIGEGEYPTLELVSQLEKDLNPSGIPNLWIKQGNGIEKNSPRPFLQNLDDLPFPDREMWMDWMGEQLGSRLAILLGRGCPFECTYCCNHGLKRISTSQYVRLRSPDNILKEMRHIADRFPAKREIHLEVESFGMNKEWATGLCSKLGSFNKTLKKPFSFGVNLRVTPNAEFEELFTACKSSNFKSINIGLESGSERVRSKILKRNYSNEDIIKAVKLARKLGLRVTFFNMMGIPGETPDDFQETVKINRICLPDNHFTYIFFPYPGTELYLSCKKSGLLKRDLDTEMERSKAVLDIPDFSRKQIQKSYVWFDYHVYNGYKPIYKILARVFVLKIRSNPYLEFIFRRLTRLFLLRWIKYMLRRY